ncbi:hypothetical protein BKA00_007421 [Actinomadura coerulea]|uniref:Terminase n=1 Tax=Actinomadura coerulea TaxID=46159 RepID=A0A7X0G897_9ACTN|nr:terminase [Actinomadura coerulea]MBB6400507.1 hypothetical protein [Actinomadura coerulea]GGQ07734.1 terminase [Actinomadura coerulea]
MQRYSIGPTWETDPEKLPLPREDLHQTPDGFWIPKPTRSLGYAGLTWGLKNVLQPDGPRKGLPFKPTAEQLRFILWWYAVDANGQFVYVSGMFQRMKGAGKDPLGAFLCLLELLGPCRFGGWNADGTPRVIAHSAPWVAVTAVSEEQTRNTMGLLGPMLSDAAREKYGVDAGQKIWHTTAGILQAFASSFRSLEGKRTSFVLMNETHHWVAGNSGHSMAEVIENNGVKSRDGAARTLAITNAHIPGEDSVAERMWDGYQSWLGGRLVQDDPPYLVDSLQAPPDTDLADDDSLRAGIIAARGDADWLDVDRVMKAVRDPRKPVSQSRRYFLNQVVAAEDAFVSAPEWDAIAAEGKAVSPEDEIVMFFDGSVNDDSTALVGCRVSDGHIFSIAGWDCPAGPAGNDWRVDKGDVDRIVRGALQHRNVLAFWGDVLHFEGHHDAWATEFGHKLLLWAREGKFRHATAWDMRLNTKPFTEACERFYADVGAGAITHDGDPALRLHMLNARRRPNRFGVGIGKENRDSPRKVDRAVCAVGAHMLRRMLLESGRMEKRKQPGVLIAF